MSFVPLYSSGSLSLEEKHVITVYGMWFKYGGTVRDRQQGGSTLPVQVLWRTFVDNNAPPGMRFSVEVIASAINQFYESSSLHKIQRTLQLDFGMRPDHANILRWVAKYTKIAAKELNDLPVRAGSV